MALPRIKDGDDATPEQLNLIYEILENVKLALGPQGGGSVSVTKTYNEQSKTFTLTFNNIKGEKGDPATTVKVGNVTQLAAGRPPTVVGESSGSEMKLNFGIPAGAKGDAYTTLKAGNTYTLAPGNSSRVVFRQVDVGTNEIYLDFYIPRGYNGVSGTDGSDGEPSTKVSIFSTRTLAAGSAAYVQDAYPTDENRIGLIFGIPQGKQGLKGDPATDIRVGGVTELAEGSRPTVTASLSTTSDGEEIYTLYFGIPKGAKGDQGDPTAKISRVSAVPLPAGSAPTISNVGTEIDAKFVFGIPIGEKGKDGEKGTKGDAYANIKMGSVSSGDEPSASLVPDTSEDAGDGDVMLNLVLPRGQKGADGTQGKDGAKGAKGDAYATVAVGTTTTVAPNSPAEVVGLETQDDNGDPVCTLNFYIPKGEKGDTATEIRVGSVTSLSAGSTPTVSSILNNGILTLSFGIPVGLTGAIGPKGDAYVGLKVGTVTTGEAGETAQVTFGQPDENNNIPISFVIPKGNTGAEGKAGKDAIIDPTMWATIEYVNSCLQGVISLLDKINGESI